MAKLFLILMLGGALANGLVASKSEPPLLIDSPVSAAPLAAPLDAPLDAAR